jgi:hypothetical protein
MDALQWGDEIILIDDGSADATEEDARASMQRGTVIKSEKPVMT